ncbi:SEC14 domain and spectrin repeat-containing protein 1-B-like isoform X2 [Amblyomma americanum]
MSKTLERTCSERTLRNGQVNKTMSRIPEAADIVEVLKKRLAFLSGGVDKNGYTLLCVPAPCDDFMVQDFRETLLYLGGLMDEDDDSKVTVVVQGDCAWGNKLECVKSALQEVLGSRLNAVLIHHPHKSWDSRSSFREKHSSTLKNVTQTKLFKLVSPLQLTPEFGGTLQYDHLDWLSRQLAVEKYVKEVQLLVKHTDGALSACRGQLGGAGPPRIPLEIGPTMVEVIARTIHSGQRLLDSLQVDGEFGFKSHCGQRMAKERASAYHKVKTALDTALELQQSFQEEWSKELEVLKSAQLLEGFFSEVDTLIDWTTNEQCNLRHSQEYFDLERANATAMEIFARYSKLRQWSASLCKELPSEADTICAAMNRLDLACEGLTSQFRSRSRTEGLSPTLDRDSQQGGSQGLSPTLDHELYQVKTQGLSPALDHKFQQARTRGLSPTLSHEYHRAGTQGLSPTLGHESQQARTQGLSPTLDHELQQFLELVSTTESRLKASCDDPVTTTVQVDKLLTELKETELMIDSQLQGLRDTFHSHGENTDGEVFWLVREQVMHLKGLLTTRKQALIQAGQFLCCEENALQLVKWLDKLTIRLQPKFGQNGYKLTVAEHNRMDELARGTYSYGLRLLDDAVKLRKQVYAATTPSTRAADALFDAWMDYVAISKSLRNPQRSANTLSRPRFRASIS